MTHPSPETLLIAPEHDAMGAAILDYQTHGKAQRLVVRSTMFDDDEMPVPYLFRKPSEMPPLEQEALRMARGRILDVGAGAGCHALPLQQRGEQVKAIDVSALACQAMRLRGLADVACINLFDPRLTGRFDTILMLMNGTGIAGTMHRLPALLRRVEWLLAPGGQVLIDSSDLRYLYENEDGSMDIDLGGRYYGEMDYQMLYGKVKGQPFDWLYVDFQLLAAAASQAGLACRLVMQGEHYDYLAQLQRSE